MKSRRRRAQLNEYAEPVEIPGLLWDAGAPQPFVLATERRTFFAFMTPLGGDQGFAVAELLACTSIIFGFPNDEVQQGHRLFAHGLEFYGLHQVHNSTWLSELRRVEKHHDRAPKMPFPDAHHFILLFHDSMLEAIAKDVVHVGMFDSETEAMTFMREEASV